MGHSARSSSSSCKSVQFSRFIKISFTYPQDEYDRSALEPAKLTFSEASELLQLRVNWKRDMNRRLELQLEQEQEQELLRQELQLEHQLHFEYQVECEQNMQSTSDPEDLGHSCQPESKGESESESESDSDNSSDQDATVPDFDKQNSLVYTNPFSSSSSSPSSSSYHHKKHSHHHHHHHHNHHHSHNHPRHHHPCYCQQQTRHHLLASSTCCQNGRLQKSCSLPCHLHLSTSGLTSTSPSKRALQESSGSEDDGDEEGREPAPSSNLTGQDLSVPKGQPQ